MENKKNNTAIAIVISILVIVALLLVTGVIDLSGSNSNVEEKIDNSSVSSISETNQKVLDNSGVGVEELVVGEGKKLEIGNAASVNYKGSLEDGTVFDSSEGKAPLKFVYGAGQLIPGFEIGMLDMKVGGKRIVKVPAKLGYGDQEVGSIPANSNLIFEIELVDVEEVPQSQS